MNGEAPETRGRFRRAYEITTRWLDQDPYDHINNVVYYSWFDTTVNAFLIGEGLLDPGSSPIIGLVVESGCRYLRPVGFPAPVSVMLRVGHLGNSSVRYELGVFTEGEDIAAALGHFVHVYVDRETRRPVPVPTVWREKLGELQRPQ